MTGLAMHAKQYSVAVSGLRRISDHVHWLPPAKPDRPSLCAVVGEHATLMLDTGASDAHARLFLDALAAEGVEPPIAVVLTHADWDHVFGAVEVGAPVIAHQRTDVALAELAATDWGDEALDARGRSGGAEPGARREHQGGDARTAERSGRARGHRLRGWTRSRARRGHRPGPARRRRSRGRQHSDVPDGRSLEEAAALSAARDDLGDDPSEQQADLIRAFLAGRAQTVTKGRS
jgi:hypothetical protein